MVGKTLVVVQGLRVKPPSAKPRINPTMTANRARQLLPIDHKSIIQETT